MGIRGSEEGQSSYVGPARSATGRIHATSVDAPFRARGNFRIAVARSRMLPSVRHLARPLDRRPAWEFADRVHINAAYSRYGVAHWFSRSRLADCCAMLSLRSPYASVTAAGLRRHARSLVRAALDQQGPDDAGHLVGQGDGDQHARLAREHPRQPRARRCPTLTGPADHGAGTEDQQPPDGSLAHLRDSPELLLAAGRLLRRRQPQPG